MKGGLSPDTFERRGSSFRQDGAASTLATLAFLACLALRDAVRLLACICQASLACRQWVCSPDCRSLQGSPEPVGLGYLCRARSPPVTRARGNASQIGGDLRSLRRSRCRSARGLSYQPMMQAYSHYSLAARAHVSACSSFACREWLPGKVETPRRAAFNSDMRRIVARIMTNCRRE